MSPRNFLSSHKARNGRFSVCLNLKHGDDPFINVHTKIKAFIIIEIFILHTSSLFDKALIILKAQ